MIAIRLKGRLGNQLFQYAFAISVSKKLKSKFYIDNSDYAFLLPKYFNIEKDLTSYIIPCVLSNVRYENVFNINFKKKFYRILKWHYRLNEVRFTLNQTPKSELLKVRNQSLFLGYYQSEEYFKEYKNIIKDLFSIKEKFVTRFKAIKNELSLQNFRLIVIHVRRGDYVNLGWNIPATYYHHIINEISCKNDFYVLISDDPEYAKFEFNYLNNCYISTNSEIIDFQFLNNADVCILSSSSFSWWGAYLNKKENKKVYIPKYYLGIEERREFPVNIIPSEWNQVEVTIK